MSADPDIPYARELAARSQSVSNGVLTATYEGQSRRVYMREGRVAFAATSLDTERLGRLLVRSGDLEERQIAEAVAGSKKEGVLFGEWLVSQGALTQQKLMWGLRQQVERITCASFAWPAADIHFEASAEQPLGFRDFRLPVVNLILEGARRFLPVPLAIDVLNGIGERTVLAERFDDVLRDVRIGPEEERIISLMDGKRSPEEIARLTLIEADDVYRIAAGFVLIGAVVVPPREEAWERDTDRVEMSWQTESAAPTGGIRVGLARPDTLNVPQEGNGRDVEEPTAHPQERTPLATTDPAVIAADALPAENSVLVLSPDKATHAWRAELDTATESILVWFDGQRTLGDVLDVLDRDADSVQVISRLCRDGYLTVAGTSQPVAASRDGVKVVRVAQEPARASNASAGDEQQELAEALLQQADRLVEAGARAVEAGNYDTAVKFFQRALRKSPDHPDALLGLGTSRYGMNDRGGARIAWESFLRVEPEGSLSRHIRRVLDSL